MQSWVLALAVSLGAASPAAPVATWPPAVATCDPHPPSSRFAAPCRQSDPALVEMFAKAREHDVVGVQHASARVRISSDTRDDGLPPQAASLVRAFALALADPPTYETAYLRAFIAGAFTDYSVLDAINQAGLAPSAFAVIDRRAKAGDGLAYAAILGAVAPRNEFRAPFAVDGWDIVHNDTKIFAAMVAAGPTPVARYLSADERDNCAFAQHTAARLKATTPKGRALLSKLKAMVANCSVYDPNY